MVYLNLLGNIMKSSFYIILAILLLTGILFGTFWYLVNEVFNLAIKLSGVV